MRVQNIDTMNSQKQVGFKAYNTGVIKSLLKEKGYKGDMDLALRIFDLIEDAKALTRRTGSDLTERSRIENQRVLMQIGNMEDSCTFHGQVEAAEVSFNPPETFPKRLLEAYQLLMSKFAAYSKDAEGSYHF